MPDKVINLDDRRPGRIRECICINCKTRFLSWAPLETRLIQLECPGCLQSGFVVDTGENV